MHDAKSHDYSENDSPFSNFSRAADFAGKFTNPMDKVFATLIGVKFSRLEQLLPGKIPKNESIDDSFMDMVNYTALWGAYHREKTEASWGTVPESLRHSNGGDDLEEILKEKSRQKRKKR